MNEKRKITDEEKRQVAKLFKGLIPNGTLDEDDILWIMNEVENGNRDISFEDFMKAKQEGHDKCATKKSEEPHLCSKCKYQDCKAYEEPCKNCCEWIHFGDYAMDSKWEPKEEEPHFCEKCKHFTCKENEEPCKSCNEIIHLGSLTMDSKWEPKEEKAEEPHLCKYCKFVEDPVFEEPCSSCFVFDRDEGYYHKNWQPVDKKEEEEEEKESEDICCLNCKFSSLTFADDPCKRCLKLDTNQPKGLKHTCFEKGKFYCYKCKHGNEHFYDEPCKSCLINGNHINFEAKESVVIKDNSPSFGPNMMKEEEIKISDSTIIRSIKSHQINLEKANHTIEDKIDKLTEALESVNSKLDILDQRMHDLRQHQILKDMRCVTQVKGANKDILEKLDNIEQVVMKNSIGINTTYEKASAVHDEVCKDEDICKDCNYYGMCSGYEGDMIYCKNFKKKDISSAKEPEPLFKVGDKVKLKAGKTVYTVLSVTHFMCGDRKAYRYRISHSATTPHYENEDRLIKA